MVTTNTKILTAYQQSIDTQQQRIEELKSKLNNRAFNEF